MSPKAEENLQFIADWLRAFDKGIDVIAGVVVAMVAIMLMVAFWKAIAKPK